jgi:hypothetical protein
MLIQNVYVCVLSVSVPNCSGLDAIFRKTSLLNKDKDISLTGREGP